MIKCTGSNVSPVDRKWQAISEMQLSHLAQISPLLLATTWLFFIFFFCTTTSISFSHTHSRSLSPCCLATMLVNVIPLVCDWLTGRQIRERERRGGDMRASHRENVNLESTVSWRIGRYSWGNTYNSLFPLHVLQQAEPCMCVDARVVCNHKCLACSVQRLYDTCL